MPLSDFRARRRVLLRSDFAIAPTRDPKPTDKIGKDVWNHIFILPDDVAVRTTNHNGVAIKQISDLSYEWLLHCDGEDTVMGPVMLDAHDDFDAAAYNTIVGYYRLSISAMRSALELVTVGTWAQVCGKKREFKQWQKGKIELGLGRACDGLIGSTSSLNDQLRAKVNDTPFDQRALRSKGGLSGDSSATFQIILIRAPDSRISPCSRAMVQFIERTHSNSAFGWKPRFLHFSLFCYSLRSLGSDLTQLWQNYLPIPEESNRV